MSVQKKAKLFSLRCLLMDLIRITGALPGLVWLRPKIRYTAKQAKKRLRGGVLVIANHTSFIDPACMMYVLWYRRLYFVCHQAFVETKAGPFFHAAGCLIPINADNFSVGSFRSITESLRDGKAVTLFPEGHVNKGDEMLEFKSGMVLMRRHWYSRLKAVVGEPVDITSLSEGRPAFSKIQEVTALLKKREEELEAFAETI